MMIFSLVAMTGLEKCCITSAYLQWLCHSGERPVAHGPLVFIERAFDDIEAYVSIFLNKTCCGYSLELPWRGDADE